MRIRHRALSKPGGLSRIRKQWPGTKSGTHHTAARRAGCGLPVTHPAGRGINARVPGCATAQTFRRADLTMDVQATQGPWHSLRLGVGRRFLNRRSIRATKDPSLLRVAHVVEFLGELRVSSWTTAFAVGFSRATNDLKSNRGCPPRARRTTKKSKGHAGALRREALIGVRLPIVRPGEIQRKTRRRPTVSILFLELPTIRLCIARPCSSRNAG